MGEKDQGGMSGILDGVDDFSRRVLIGVALGLVAVLGFGEAGGGAALFVFGAVLLFWPERRPGAAAPGRTAAAQETASPARPASSARTAAPPVAAAPAANGATEAAAKPAPKPEPAPAKPEPAAPAGPSLKAPPPSRASGKAPMMLSAPVDDAPDDLKLLKGVGPKLEAILNGMGFYHFDQIAAWSDEEVAWVDETLEGVNRGRASRDGWVQQARVLATGALTEFAKRVEAGEVPTSS